MRDGVVVDSESWMVQPPQSVGEFAPRNVQVHGIRAVEPEDPFHCSVDLARRLLNLEVNKLPHVAKALGLVIS